MIFKGPNKKQLRISQDSDKLFFGIHHSERVESIRLREDGVKKMHGYLAKWLERHTKDNPDRFLPCSLCQKCKMLFALYDQAPKTNKNYWIMTELFVLLHDGKDECVQRLELEKS